MASTESPGDTTLTVGEWMSEWLERHQTRIRHSTHEGYKSAVRNWIVPHLGTIQLAALTHRHIEAMNQAVIEAGQSPQTVRRHYSPLRSALQAAVRDGLVSHNPAALVGLPPTQKPEINPFTTKEARAFLGGNRENQLYPIYHLALHSGLRLGEIAALRVSRDIDLTERTLTIRETRRQGVTGRPKSRESARRVSLAPEAVEVLREAVAHRPRGELAFPMDPGVVSRSMPGACDRAGVKRVRFHDLRHTHATSLIESGENIRAVSARLGHASSSFTLQVYAHVMPGMDEQLAEASGILFSTDAINTLSLDVNGATSERPLTPV